MVENRPQTGVVQLPPAALGPGRPAADVMGSALGSVFETLSGMRRARTFHPRGIVVRSDVDVPTETSPAGFPTGRHPVLVRLSRGIGFPGRIPDIPGVAIRFVGAGGPGVHQDLLLATTFSGPVSRRILRPTATFTSGLYTSLLPYDASGRRVLFAASLDAGGAEPHDIDDLTELLATSTLTLTLHWATPTGGWQPIVPILLGPTDEVSDVPSLAFDISNCVPDLRPAGWFNRLRPGAYAGSRKGRALADVLDHEVPPGADGEAAQSATSSTSETG